MGTTIACPVPWAIIDAGALVAAIAVSYASGLRHSMVQARERRAMVLSGLQEDSEAAIFEITSVGTIVEKHILVRRRGRSFATPWRVSSRLNLEVPGIVVFMTPKARRLSSYLTQAARVARNMIGRDVGPGRSRFKLFIKETPCHESWGRADLAEAT